MFVYLYIFYFILAQFTPEKKKGKLTPCDITGDHRHLVGVGIALCTSEVSLLMCMNHICCYVSP